MKEKMMSRRVWLKFVLYINPEGMHDRLDIKRKCTESLLLIVKENNNSSKPCILPRYNQVRCKNWKIFIIKSLKGNLSNFCLFFPKNKIETLSPIKFLKIFLIFCISSLFSFFFLWDCGFFDYWGVSDESRQETSIWSSDSIFFVVGNWQLRLILWCFVKCATNLSAIQ
jgi:hypothetical protein